MSRYPHALATTLLGVLALALGAAPGGAATFSVDSTVDAVDVVPGDGKCQAIGPFGSKCTLRAAVQEANAWPGADTIVVPAGTYLLTIPGSREYAAASGDLNLLESVAIIGAGAADTIVDAGGIDRAFHVDAESRGWAVTLAGLTIRNGSIVRDVSDPFFTPEGGGALLSWASDFGTLRVEDCLLHDNESNVGGAVVTNNRTLLELHRTTVRDNHAEGWPGYDDPGGGVSSWGGPVVLDRSTVSGNTGGCGVTIEGASTIEGGGLAAVNSTISGNDGGVCVNDADFVDLTMVTVAHNAGFGLRQIAGTTAWHLQHTLVANHPAADCAGALAVVGDYNLDSDGSCSLAGGHDLSGVDPKLGPLAPNAGPTATHALLAGSPAVNSGVPPGPNGCNGIDQRGVARPQGPACDRGAYERRACGLGAELAGVLGLLAARRGRSRPGREPG